MPVPPLEHRILHAAPGDVRFRAEHRHRQRRIVAEVKHRDREDEGEIEPVRDEDVRFLALDQRHQEHQQIGHPDDGQPQIGIPFGLGIFLRLRDPEQIAGASDQNEEIVADHDEPRREIAGETYPAGLLNDIERGCDQDVAAEGEDHGRGMQRPQPAETGPGQIEIERRPRQLRRDQEPDGKAGDSPEHRHDRGELDRAHIVVGSAIDFLRRQRAGRSKYRLRMTNTAARLATALERSMKGERPHRRPWPRRPRRERRSPQISATSHFRRWSWIWNVEAWLMRILSWGHDSNNHSRARSI